MKDSSPNCAPLSVSPVLHAHAPQDFNMNSPFSMRPSRWWTLWTWLMLAALVTPWGCDPYTLEQQRADECVVGSEGCVCGWATGHCNTGLECVAGRCERPCGLNIDLAKCDGQCINTSADRQNCGDCGVVCATGAVCTDGGCRCPDNEILCNGQCVAVDTTNCGGCGIACATGASCVNNQCTCPNDGLVCDGRCVDDSTDNRNCGGCGVSCAQGGACEGGVCACPNDGIVCGQTCIDTSNNTANCGACGVSCAQGAWCVGGQCRCPNNGIVCNGQCVAVDTANCGGCGVRCATGASCVNNQCTCPNDGIVCNGQCVDDSSDNRNCGGCGVSCAQDGACEGGVCACPNNGIVCGQTCIDTSNNTANCGACGVSCAQGAQCVGGQCRCPSNGIVCNGQCVPVDTANCGGCGVRCAQGGHCIGGICGCPDDGIVCSGQCVDDSSDVHHCGGCGVTCPAAAVCSNGQCECWPGREGTNCEGTKFVYIPAGTFTQGPSGGISRQVTITRPFYMQATEVTQGQWRTLMGNNPSQFTACGDDCPVENVGWSDAMAYMNALSAREGLQQCYDLSGCSRTPGTGALSYSCRSTWNASRFVGLSCTGYRLPTEAEWEYAARAGTTTTTYNGTFSGTNCAATMAVLDPIAWYGCNSGSTTHRAGLKQPNNFELYDMLGNVWEWTQDIHVAYTTASVSDPVAITGTNSEVVRGGTWLSLPESVVAMRRGDGRGYVDDARRMGFRPVRTATGATNPPTGNDVSYTNTTRLAIPDNNATGVTSTINVPTSGSVVSVAVDVNITHTYRGDLVVYLERTSGRYEIARGSGNSRDLVLEQLAVNRFIGEDAQGAWKLVVVDTAADDTGHLESWTLYLSVR